MQTGWQALLEDIWPSRSVPRQLLWRRDALLFVVIAVVIAVASGPEIFAAIEMTTLMELLGASLFMTALGSGARLALSQLWEAVGRIILPTPQLAIVRADAPATARAAALGYVAVHAAWCVMLAFVVAAWGRFVFQLGW